MSGWTKLPPLDFAPRACLCCPPRAIRVPLRTNPHPGFGGVSLLRDGENVETTSIPERSRTFIHYENVASKDPDHDWRVRVDGPLYGCVYQRHGAKEWVMVEKLDGFA